MRAAAYLRFAAPRAPAKRRCSTSSPGCGGRARAASRSTRRCSSTAREEFDVPTRLRRIGYVFQEARLFPHLSVAHNLTYGARFASRGPSLVAFAEVVALLGLEPLLARGPARLSGGEKQRVAIGRALLSNPRVLLMDEPLNAIDDARRHDILSLIETLRDAFAIPIIFVSHRVSEVERLASDIAEFEEGRLVALRGPRQPASA